MIERPRALLFDVQGTATDFHTTAARQARRLLGSRYPDLNWSRFVNDWRAAYFEGTKAVGDEWISVATIYRRALDDLLTRRDLELDETARRELTDTWKRLDPWPDARPGLLRLRPAYTLATLSNADVDAVVSISRHCDFPWHAVFAAEMAGAFKPDPRAYTLAARYLGLPPEAIMMVASHKYDLRAAAAEGMRTAFVARPDEYGDPALADVEFEAEFDINAGDFGDLADQLGC
ncbi:haloacid dehalogenase type II [Nocardia pseudobrasiliensis]|uniref:2-haloacid dehalogenase n=1 Tax=Nocardia pseudobrasiliensis TaxID=45979 RepID=A0A370I9K3_9NOCA|nr:haloacid dehalogenase type II [Nocardia pseudobrasiliensis]RDI67320.1 2-haloacid dehalogenase [Nocardia pseudobrasiliensis]